jgi:hypothetical protein
VVEKLYSIYLQGRIGPYQMETTLLYGQGYIILIFAVIDQKGASGEALEIGK